MISCTCLYKELIKASSCALLQNTNATRRYQERKISWTITSVLASTVSFMTLLLVSIHKCKFWAYLLLWAYLQKSPQFISHTGFFQPSSKKEKLLEDTLHWSRTSAINNSLWHLPFISPKASSKQLTNSSNNYSFFLQDSTQLSNDQEQL